MIEELRDEVTVRPGETEEEYINRICALHEQYDIIWDDIAAIINRELGCNHTESWARRKWKSYNLGLVKGDATTNTEVSVDKQLSQEAIDFRERVAAASDKIDLLKTLRHDARFERFYKHVGDGIAAAGSLEVPIYIGRRTPLTTKKYIVPIADLHLGAKFDSVNNKYSIEEAKRRMELAAQDIIEFVEDKGLTEITVLSLGDMIQGMLRTTDLRLNETDVVNAFVYVIRLMAGFLNKISEYCKVNYIQICYSNHEQNRYLGTKASELAGEDMGKISFAYLQDVLKYNTRINIMGDVDKDYFEFKIFDFCCFAAHGHQVKSLTEITKDLGIRHHKFYDYVFLAHSHSTKELIAAEGAHHDIEVLVAPSIVGSDPYADKLYVGSKSAIKIFGFDQKYGHVESYKYILN